MILIILSTFVLAFILQRIVGGPLGSALFFPAWSPGLLLVSLKLRNGFRKWVFEVDREVANKLGLEGILEVLDRMKSLDPKANPSTRLARFLAFWSPSINDRNNELRNPRPITLPKRMSNHFLSVDGRWIDNRKIDEPTGRRSGPCGRSLAWSRT